MRGNDDDCLGNAKDDRGKADEGRIGDHLSTLGNMKDNRATPTASSPIPIVVGIKMTQGM